MLRVVLPRFTTLVLLAALLGAPFVLVARAQSRLVAPLSELAVSLLLRVSAPLAPRAAPPPAPELAFDDATTELARELSAKSSGRAAPSVGRAKPSSLFVSQATVLRLARSAARPSGAFVAKTPDHPAGLRLSGVAALGIGLRDGDILIEALGVTPRSPGEIVGAIIEARARRVPALSGTLWRRGQTFHITVEQPYA